MSDQTTLDGLAPRTCLRLGRSRTWHLPRVLIEGDRIVLRTRCGLAMPDGGFTETTAIATCADCVQLEAIA